MDTNVMAGRAGILSDNGMYDGLVYLPCVEKNDFVPEFPKEEIDIIYLCFPNNPTGTTLTNDQLTKFADYTRKDNAVILFDAA